MMRKAAALLLCLCASTSLRADPVPNADSLSQVMAKALEASEELSIAREKIEQTKATLGEAHSLYMPQVTISTKAGRNAAYPSSNRSLGDPRGASEYVNTSSSKLEVNQMLFDGFRTPAEVNRQRKLLEGLKERYRTLSQEVMRTTLTAYLTAWRNMQALRAGVILMDDMQEINRKVALQAKLGAADQASKSFTEARLTGARQELLKNRNAYRDAIYRLSYQLHTPLQPENFTIGQLEAPQLQDREKYISLMESNNPQLLEERANEAAAKAEVRKARANFYPTLMLTSDLEDSNDIGGSSGNARIGNVLVQASYKIFDGYASRYAAARVASQLTEARLRQQRTQRQLTEDISQLWRQTKATQQEFNLAMEEVNASRKVLEVRQQDVDNGTGDIVRLIEAQENHYAAVLRLIDLAQAIAAKRFDLAISSGQLEDTGCFSNACGNHQLVAVFPSSAPLSSIMASPAPAAAAVSATMETALSPIPQSVMTETTTPIATVSATSPAPAQSASGAEQAATQPQATPDDEFGLWDPEADLNAAPEPLQLPPQASAPHRVRQYDTPTTPPKTGSTIIHFVQPQTTDDDAPEAYNPTFAPMAIGSH